MTRILLLFALGCGPLLGLCHSASAADRTSIALTAASAESDRKLAEVLIALVESNVLADDSLAVVERRQIELAMQELALSRTRSADESLQLGKLVTADILVMLELRQTDSQSAKPSAMLRVVEAKTAAIRGITVSSDIDETSLDDVAEQFARYVSLVVREPQTPTITVAVAPFESVGRFDRLRPLELGIRDLVTARLLRLSGTDVSRAEGRQPPDDSHPGDRSQKNTEPVRGLTPSDSPRISRFQILQRSNMEQLLRELDLMQSGLADKDRLPLTLPNREAAYLIRGEIDERQVDGKFTIMVRGDLRHAATAKVRESFEFECSPAELENQLAARVDQLGKHLGVLDASRIRTDTGRVGHEAQSLKSLALRDLSRFRRQCPIDFSPREFRLPSGAAPQDVPRMARPGTPLGDALLRKSIDRLESVLFIHPDDAEAAYSLGFCYSIDEPGIYRPARADELLRKAYSLQPQTPLAARALAFLSEIAFHHQTAELDKSQRAAAAERLWFAFEQTPEPLRDRRWPRMLELFVKLELTPQQTVELLAKAAPYAEQAHEAHLEPLASAVHTLAYRLALPRNRDQGSRAAGLELLRRWSQLENPELANFGLIGLARVRIIEKDFLGAANLYQEAAAKIGDLSSPKGRDTHDNHLIHAAKNLRLAKQPELGLQLMLSLEPKPIGLASNLVGAHRYEMGACYEALGEREKALSEYLRAADECPNIVQNRDLVERVVKLGGVPLRADRDIDVTYVLQEGKEPARGTKLATDGQKLYLGGLSVYVFDPRRQTWTTMSGGFGHVTCLKIRDGELWVGTRDHGLWRYDLTAKTWTKFGIEQGLPDLHIESLALYADDVYAGVGRQASGGLVRIDSQKKIHLFQEAGAPRAAPTYIIVDDKRLVARTLQTIHEWSFESKTWRRHPPEPNRPVPQAARLFAGATCVWASNYGRELTRWEADAQANELFQSAWYFVPGTKAGYQLNFVAERGDEVWFGGDQWDYFTSSGLYRINLKSGSFHKFTPADGLKTEKVHEILDGLWLHDRLWLATSNGLCVVTPHK